MESAPRRTHRLTSPHHPDTDMDISTTSTETLAQGVLERVFMRNPKGSHSLANAVRDASDALGAQTREERAAVAELLAEGFADLEASGTIMRDLRTAEIAWLLTPANLTDRPPGAGTLTRAEDYQVPL
jgi:hypothetical protein